VILSGSDVRTENVRLLATMLGGDQLADKLERAVANNNSIVGLSLDDRERIAEVLAAHAPAPWGLAELQSVLVAQLKKHKAREAQDVRVRLSRARAPRDREPLG
jgi:hypothetical protein